MENRKLNSRWQVFLPVLSLVFVFDCAKPDTVVIEQPVGPSPNNTTSSGPGWLIVYTDIGYKDRVPRRLGLVTATLVVMANMIGTGVFTTTGLLLVEMRSPSAVLLAWLVGGVIALCGALAYAELAACIARNGGEYRMLSDTFHPAVGFVAGWVCLVVGFSAPIAASSMAFGKYLHALLPGVQPIAAGIVLIVLLSTVHAARVTVGAWLQNLFTQATVLLILVFILGTAWILRGSLSHRLAMPSHEQLLSPGFAVGLVLVTFAYGG